MVHKNIESVKNKSHQGFTFENHKYLGQYLKHRRYESLILSCVSTWCYTKSSKICRLTYKHEKAITNLKAELDNIVCGETAPNSILFKNGYDPEIDPVKCYFGETEFAEHWEHDFAIGFRKEFQIGSPLKLQKPFDFPRRRNGFTLDEHRHVARILRRQVRQASITIILIWNTYGKRSEATQSAYNWWKVGKTLFSELNKVSGDIPDLYLPEHFSETVEAEMIADQSFAQPLITRLPKSKLDKILISDGMEIEFDFKLGG
ncbi:MAG: hypothetical protein F6K62_04960 [Sphaerospermopsis sp. SIO1G2]|nr:hypothetical protein [Sphaerospermopsis sp. SIO1G2]